MQTPLAMETPPSKDKIIVLRDHLYFTAPLSISTKRYEDRSQPIEWPSVEKLPAGRLGILSIPAHLASCGWEKYTHPEGKPYFVRDSSPRIVTEADITDAKTLTLIEGYAQLISDWAAEQSIPLDDSVELFLEPEVDTGYCDYYFIDHAARTTFWVEEGTSLKLSLPMTCSHNHLMLALEENYWQHLEMFSMHLDDLSDAREELIAIHLHAVADLSTSRLSTWPLSLDMTQMHLQILKDCRVSGNPVTFAVIGRLWKGVIKSRFQTLYGESGSRLDRTTRIFAHEEEKPSLFARCLSAIMFGLPDVARSQLEEQCVDQLVVAKHWAEFANGHIAEWETTMQWTFALAIFSALSVHLSLVPFFANIMLALCAISLLTAVPLRQRFKSMSQDTVDDAISLLRWQDEKMMPLAIVLCIPRATFLWALVLFALQAFSILLSFVPWTFGLMFYFALLASALLARNILYVPNRYARRPPAFFSLFRRSFFSFLRRGERLEEGNISV